MVWEEQDKSPSASEGVPQTPPGHHSAPNSGLSLAVAMSGAPRLP